MTMWIASAPSNIALIKYMGKNNTDTNEASNPSLSYTLPHLITTVMLTCSKNPVDTWEPLGTANPLQLSDAGQIRFLNHLTFLKKQFEYTGNFIVQSKNNFPMSAGLASSASSFAALTSCACQALSSLTKKELPELEEQAQWSRQGSGSSCRSFFEPWTIWEGNEVYPVDLPYETLIHHVILIEKAPKSVSSSEAHKRVMTSPNYEGRTERACQRLEDLTYALSEQLWEDAYHICFEEFTDMHELFETSIPPFSYQTEESKRILNLLQEYWIMHGDGPIITMDAGANIHMLFREDQKALSEHLINTLGSNVHVI